MDAHDKLAIGIERGRALLRLDKTHKACFV